LNAYEGMFVIDLSEVKKDTNEVEELVEGLIKKCGGELASMARWDERKLAYQIKGRDNGLYTLTYFNGGQDTVRQLNRECRLSSHVLRALFLRLKEIPDIDAVIGKKNDRAARDDRYDDGPTHRRREGPKDSPPAAAPAASGEGAPKAAEAAPKAAEAAPKAAEAAPKAAEAADSAVEPDAKPADPAVTAENADPVKADAPPVESSEAGEGSPDAGALSSEDSPAESPDTDGGEEKPRADG